MATLTLSQLPLEMPPALATQVLRVAAHLAPEIKHKDLPSAALGLFKRSGRLPEVLLDTVVSASEPDLKSSCELPWMAAGFSAALYPQLAYRMEAVETQTRAKAFFEVWRQLSQISSSEKAAHRILLDILQGLGRFSLSPGDAEVFLEDLVSASFPPQTADQVQAREERLLGAAWFVATCPPALMQRIIENWQREAPLVRYFRDRLNAPPSQVLDQVGQFNRVEVAKKLRERFQEFPVDLHAAVAELEQVVRHRFLRFSSVAQVPQRVEAFWTATYSAVLSGFPHFSFQSSFRAWWTVCADNFSFHSKEADHLPERRDIAQPDRSVLSMEELGVYRELYRVVRATFFRLPQRGLRPAAIIKQNEHYRRAADELWRDRLERGLEGHPPERLLAEVAEEFDLSQHDVVNLSHRLRLRVLAAGLARFDRLKNSQILSSHARGPAGKTAPLKAEAGVRTIASLAKTACNGASLLWAFTSLVFLREYVAPQRRDPWTLERFAWEVHHWMGDPEIPATLTERKKDKNPPEQAFEEVLRAADVDEFTRKLATFSDEKQRWEWLQTADLSAVKSALVDVLDRHFGCAWRSVTKTQITRWKRIIGKYPHWLIPVWYLTVIEKLDDTLVLERLVVDHHERPAVAELSRAITSERPRGKQ